LTAEPSDWTLYKGPTKMRDLSIQHKTALPTWILVTPHEKGEAPVYLTTEPKRALLFSTEAKALRFRNLFAANSDTLDKSYPRQIMIQELLGVLASDPDAADVEFFLLDPLPADVTANMPKGDDAE